MTVPLTSFSNLKISRYCNINTWSIKSLQRLKMLLLQYICCIAIRVSTEFRRLGIPRNFLTSEVISAQFRRNSAKFRGIPRNFAGIAPEITSVFRGMPKCHFRGHPNCDKKDCPAAKMCNQL